MQPRIGITPSYSEDKTANGALPRYVLSTPYVNAVLAAGALPLILPPQSKNAEAVLDTLDGLLLSGGADVAPARYGDTAIHPTTYGVNPERDAFEAALIAGAVRRDLPVLAICRGIQILNVALGGTLIQDIADQTGSPIEHNQHKTGLPRHTAAHDVTLVSGTLLADLFSAPRIPTNSFHHQAIRELAPALAPAGHAEDGIIEAVIHPNQTFMVGVEWHPEGMVDHEPAQRALFTALVEHAIAYRDAASVSQV